jgi:integrase/recombinase XerD
MQEIITTSNLNIAVYSDDERKNLVWTKAFEAWISNISSTNTVRAYKESWKYFLTFTGKPPWRIGRSSVVDYINHMRSNGLADSTIQQRLAGLSSFYDFVCRDYTIINKEDREVPLYDINPASSKILRKRITPYQKANWMTKEEVKIFLGSINRDTIQGSRDYALFLTYILTGRRNSELRNLKWGDINIASDGCVIYKWSGKYVQSKKSEMPKICYDAIVKYLEVSGRLKDMTKDDYVFVATNNNATRLPNVKHNNILPGTTLLSMREVGKLLKKYCKLSGFTKILTLHSIRHSATMLRRDVGNSVEEVSHFLGHNGIVNTETYIHSLEGIRDRSRGKVEALLDLE